MKKGIGVPRPITLYLLFWIKPAPAIKKWLVLAVICALTSVAMAQTCTVINSVPATPPTSGVLDILVSAAGSANYLVAGTRIYDTYNIDGKAINYTTVPATNYFWNNAPGSTKGPLQRTGVWGKSNPKTLGFSVCVEIPESKTYYMGIAADNSGTLKIDGNTILQDIDFVYWQIYKITLAKGIHFVEFQVVNFQGPAALGFEIYNNTKTQIMDALGYYDLDVVFTTSNEVGLNVEEGDASTSYSCPIGYILDYCAAGVPVCSQFAPINFTITDPPPVCLSEAADITSPQITNGSSSGLTYTYWKDKLATVPLDHPEKITTSGTYYILGTSDGCSSIKPVNVLIQSVNTTVNGAVCLGGNYGGHSKSGTYVDTLKALSNGCDSIRTLNLTVTPTVATNQNLTICRGDNYNGHTKTGMYTDTVVTTSGCDSLVVTNLTVSPDFSLGPNRTLCLGDSILLKPGLFKSYLWQDGSILPYYKVVGGGIYWVKVTDENGCTGADTVAIAEQTCTINKIPNTFTPNGDGINDTWNIKGLQAYPQCSVFIYSRWGQLVFKSKGYSNPWDGRENGKELPAGTYYYVIDLKDNSPKMSGYITIVR